jgi:hypothetical protein
MDGVSLDQSTQVARQDDSNTLLELAIRGGVDVSVIERLVALKERAQDRDARAAYFEALAAFQDECPQVSKTKEADIVSKRSGARFKYTYAPLDEIARVIRPVLRKHGLSYNFDVSATDSVLIVTCVVRHVDGHSERSSFPVPIDKGERMSGAQANGAALTYGKRQSLVAVLGLTTTDEDTDGAKNDVQSVEKITAKEAADLSSLIEEVKADRAKFLRWLRVENIADIPASEYQNAVRALEQKRSA